MALSVGRHQVMRSPMGPASADGRVTFGPGSEPLAPCYGGITLTPSRHVDSAILIVDAPGGLW
jgi:hypothetical protein